MSLLPMNKHDNSSYLSCSSLVLAITLALTAEHALAKKDLFSSEPASSQPASTQQMISTSNSPDVEEPTISATDAALRAQQHTDGKVMNVRQFKEENKTLYGVKMLQKNGRMKTINVDANSGSIVE